MTKRGESLTKAQIKARRTGIGASESAAIIGVSPWTTRFDVWSSKMNPAEDDDSVGQSAPAYWGNVLEPVVLEEFAYRHPELKVMSKTDLVKSLSAGHGFPVSHVTGGTFRSKEREWMLASPDGMSVHEETGEWVGVEIKTARSADGWGDSGTDEVPHHYLCQCYHSMIVWGQNKWFLPVLIGGSDYREYVIERDEQLATSIATEVEKFWREHVVTGVAPIRQNVDHVRVMYQREIAGKQVVASLEMEQVASALAQSKEDLRSAGVVVDTLTARLMEYMGSSEVLVSEDGSVLATWKSQTARRVNLARLKVEQPDLTKKFTEVSESRVFRLKKKGVSDE